MVKIEPVRIDKFLWAVRLFKTRSLAADACSAGRILVNNVPAKPSKVIGGEEIISVRKPPVTFTYKVILPAVNRIPAKMVAEHIMDITAEDEKDKLTVAQHAVIPGHRKKGSGRPTKKERRSIDRWKDVLNYSSEGGKMT